MRWQQLIVDIYKRMTEEVEHTLDGLTTADLHQRPAPGANSIGWLIWHATRSMDRTIGDAILGEQLWVRDGWHRKFNMPPDPLDTGYGHTDAQVDALKIPDVQTLLDYHRAVMRVMLAAMDKLTEEELDKEYPFSLEPGAKRAFARRILSNVHDIQHVGQAAYVRGLIKGRGWYGR
ncbi:MAG: DinB family protein [Dehalococcoidales bacterium]|jgi:hypothetical protein